MMNKRQVQRYFQMSGLTLRADACEGVLNVLKREDNPKEALGELIDSLKSQMLDDTGIVTQQLLAQVVSQLSHDSQDIMSESIQLLTSFELPRLHYDVMRKEFSLLKPETILGSPQDKIEMFIQRLALLEQRLMRQEVFRPQLVSTNEIAASVTLTPVESLLGRGGVRTLLGMLTQVSYLTRPDWTFILIIHSCIFFYLGRGETVLFGRQDWNGKVGFESMSSTI